MANEKPTVRWQDLSGEERYRVIELLRKGEVEIKALCKNFGVSRQTLHRAREAADRAAIEALTKKRPGRKSPPASEAQVKDLQQEKKRLEKALHRMGQRYEIAQTLLDLQREAEQRTRPAREKKNPRPAGGSDPAGLFTRRPPKRMATNDDGPDAGHRNGGSAPLGGETADDADD